MTHPRKDEVPEASVEATPGGGGRPPPGVPARRPVAAPSQFTEMPGGLGGALQQLLSSTGSLDVKTLLGIVQSSTSGMQLALTQLAKDVDYWRDRCRAHEEKIDLLEGRLEELLDRGVGDQ